MVFVCVVWSTENGGLLRFSFSSIEDGELHRTIHIKSYADAVTWTFVVRFFSRSTVRVVRRSCTLQLPINFPINRKGGLYITRAMKPIPLHRRIGKSLWLMKSLRVTRDRTLWLYGMGSGAHQDHVIGKHTVSNFYGGIEIFQSCMVLHFAWSFP